jgi:2-C-methyl-D-erythritol 2,4-cyclodiphosphate synthase
LENPKIAPFRERIASNVAAICQISPGQVSVKGKTSEGLGIVGQKEACVCHAVVLLVLSDFKNKN